MKPGQLNVGPDHLSRIEIGEELTNLEEGMHDKHLFAGCVADNHFADTIHFLTIVTAPKGYTSQQKKELVVRTEDFSLIAGHVYNMGAYEILRCDVPEFE